MATKLTNISNGPRGLYTAEGLVLVDAGATFEGELAKGEEPNDEWFAKPGSAAVKSGASAQSTAANAEIEAALERAERAEADLDAANAEIEELKAKLAALDGDGDGDVGGSKPAEPAALTGKNKVDLLVIAAEEGVSIEDGATNDDIIAAIRLDREAKAQAAA